MTNSFRSSVAAFIPALLICASVAAKETGPACPECWRDFRVTIVKEAAKEEDRDREFNVTGYSSRFHRVEFEGEPAMAFEMVENSREGYVVRQTVYMSPDDLKPLAGARSMENESGEVFYESRIDYRDNIFRHDPNTYPFEALGMVAHRLELRPGAVNRCHLLGGPGHTPIKINLTVEEAEEVTTPAGKFECWRIRLTYSYEQFLGDGWSFAGKILGRFAPDQFIWVQKSAPHGLVKVQGKFGPPGSAPEESHELLRIRER